MNFDPIEVQPKESFQIYLKQKLMPQKLKYYKDILYFEGMMLFLEGIFNGSNLVQD